jgi:hypothetical protein
MKDNVKVKVCKETPKIRIPLDGGSKLGWVVEV